MARILRHSLSALAPGVAELLVQVPVGSRNTAIHNAYRTSLRPSSLKVAIGELFHRFRQIASISQVISKLFRGFRQITSILPRLPRLRQR